LWNNPDIESHGGLKRKKIYYVPGMISLLGLPVLALFFLPKEKSLHTVLRFFLPYDTVSPRINSIVFSKTYVYKSIRKKKIIAVDLDQEFFSLPFDQFLFRAKCNYILREIERIQFTNDTSSVIKIDLGESNSLATFVWVVNLTVIYKIRRWAFMDNSFFLLGNPSPVKPIPMEPIL